MIGRVDYESAVNTYCVRTGRDGLAELSAELEQQLEKSCAVLSPRPLSTLLPINILPLREDIVRVV